MSKVAINGFGRIGRAACKILLDTPDVEIVAINDLVPIDNLVYLLKYDTVYGKYDKEVKAGPDSISIDGKKIKILAEKDPAKLPWKDMGIDLVFECTGRFTDKEGMQKHLQAGAGQVVLSAPSKSADVPTIIYGVNKPGEDDKLISTASCTTNSIAPVMEIIGRRLGIKKAFLSTIHAYTSTQDLVDGPNKKFRRGRAAAQNIVPSSTGAATATSKALPQFTGKFDGLAFRVPVPCGSLSDLTIILEKGTTKDEVVKILKEEAGSERYREVVEVTQDPIVSSDVLQNTHTAVLDLELVHVVDGDLLKIMSWYDNEWGYSCQMVRSAMEMLKLKAVPV